MQTVGSLLLIASGGYNLEHKRRLCSSVAVVVIVLFVLFSFLRYLKGDADFLFCLIAVFVLSFCDIIILKW